MGKALKPEKHFCSSASSEDAERNDHAPLDPATYLGKGGGRPQLPRGTHLLVQAVAEAQ
jgi:hypothetical protein